MTREIGADGCVRVGRWTLVFPAVFAGQMLHVVGEGKLALVDQQEVIGFYINLKGTPEDRNGL